MRDLREVTELVEKTLAKISQTTPETVITAGLASYVHSFYNGLENIFELIAEYIDNFKPRSEAWHKELLDQMTLDLPDIRPPVLPAELASDLQDYLEFRHFFRHSYSFYIKWDKLQPKIVKLKSIFDRIEAALLNFFIFLGAASEQLE